MKTERGKNHRMGHSKICFACGKNYGNYRSNLVYHIPTMKTYCADINKCENKKRHPQTLAKVYDHLPEYQKELINATQFDDLYKEMRSYFDHENVEGIFKFLGKTITTRVEPYQAVYLYKIAKAEGLYNEEEGENVPKVQDILRHIINSYIDNNRHELDKIKL